MTSINTTSLQQFSSLFNTSSSSIISDEYKKNLYLAKIAREDKRISTQNHIESVVETTQEGQNISHFSDEVTLSQSTKYSTPKPSATTSNLKTNTSENNQVHDNTLHQLKVRKNDLQQKLNRLTQKGSNQIPLSHHEESRGKVHDAEESATSPTNVLPTEESPLAHVLKRQIDTIEQELDKNSTTSKSLFCIVISVPCLTCSKNRRSFSCERFTNIRT